MPVRLGCWLSFAAVATAGVASTGCAQHRRFYKHPTFVTEGDVAKYLRIALEGDLPDERREAINQIARTRHRGHQVVIDAFDTIARTDPSPAVRCAALLGLRKCGGPQAFSTYVSLISPQASARQDPALTPKVRQDALRGMIALLEAGEPLGEHQAAMRDCTVELIGRDNSRDVRLACACVLGYVQERTVLEPLISALEERDFGVVFEAERSLIRLTGHSFDHDAVAWRRWLAQADDPFADAGQLDHLLTTGQKGWWRRSMDSLGRTFNSYRPQKEES